MFITHKVDYKADAEWASWCIEGHTQLSAMRESLAPAASNNVLQTRAVAPTTWQPFRQLMPGKELKPNYKPFVPESLVTIMKPKVYLETATLTDVLSIGDGGTSYDGSQDSFLMDEHHVMTFEDTMIGLPIMVRYHCQDRSMHGVNAKSNMCWCDVVSGCFGKKQSYSGTCGNIQLR